MGVKMNNVVWGAFLVILAFVTLPVMNSLLTQHLQ